LWASSARSAFTNPALRGTTEGADFSYVAGKSSTFQLENPTLE